MSTQGPMSLSTARAVGPVTDAERALAPDLGRGLMLALVALANSAIYLYDRPYGARQHIIETEPLDQVVAFLNTVLVEVRGYPLFGYGIVRAHTRYRVATGEQRARATLRRRSFWLIVFGAAHALLLFSGDILGLYGVLGLILVTMLRLGDRTLLIIAGGWLVIASLVQGLVYSDSGPNQERTFFWSFAVDEPLLAMGLRGFEWLLTPFGLLAVFSAALAGMWAARRDVLGQPDRHVRLLRWVATVGVSASVLGGVPMGLLVAGVWTSTPFGADYLVSVLHVVTGVLGGLGYGALLGLLAVRIGDRRGPVTRAVAASGQRSLSCYLFQSVVFVALFYPFTFGLRDNLGFAGACAVAVGIWLVSIVLAAWLRHKGIRGPLETLLRRLAYRRT